MTTPDHQTTTVDAGKSLAVSDGKKTTIIDSNGNIGSSADTASSAGSANTSSSISVTFSADKDQRYGFDALSYESMKNKYYTGENINGSTYYIPWKSVSAGGSDKVYARIIKAKGDTSKFSLKFIDDSGNTLQSTGNDSLKQLEVRGPTGDGTLDITASYAATDTSKLRVTAGKLTVVGYDNGEAAHNVVLVPVNGNALSGTTSAQVQNVLNKVYKQACETFTVTTGPNLTYDYQSFNANPADAVSYSDDMAALVSKIKEDSGSGYNPNNFYLFLLDKCGSPAKNAIMPFNQNFGFIFVDRTSGEATNRTIAHELGHGAFGLLHTFRTYGHEVNLDSAQTDNLMDYAGGMRLFKYQWDEIHKPITTYEETYFGKGTTGEDAAIIAKEVVNIDAGQGLNCQGKVITSFEWGKSGEYITPAISQNIPYVIVGFNVFKKGSTQSINFIPCSEFNSNTDLKLSLSLKADGVSVYKLDDNQNCRYKWQSIPWTYTEGMKVKSTVEKLLIQVNWKHETLFNADPSCFASFIEELKTLDNSNECEDDSYVTGYYTKLKTFLNGKGVISDLVEAVNYSCKSSLRKLSLLEKKDLFKRLASESEIKEEKEVAILRLMSCFASTEYEDLFALLEADNNNLLKNLVDKMNDSSVFPWDRDNYTNFIGGLIKMFKLNSDIPLKRLAAIGSHKLLSQVINLDPKPFTKPTDGTWSAFVQDLNAFRYNGSYDQSTGKVSIYREKQLMATIPGGPEGAVSTTNWVKDDVLAEDLLPLDPVVINTSSSNLPLVNTALEVNEGSKDNVVIVPAIFFKYKGDKEIQDAVKKTGYTALDIITIAASGGTALAADVVWAKRLWAALEVAGAIGDIGVNNMKVSARLENAVGYYNLAMGLIGVGHVAKGIVNFSSHVAEQLKNNENLKTLILAQYLNWKAATQSLDKLEDAESQLIAKQEQVWKALGVTEEIAKAGGKVPTSLASKLYQQGASKLETWLTGKSFKYKSLTGANAETEILKDIESAIGDKNVISVVDNGDGRFLVQCERGTNSNKVLSIEVNAKGEQIIYEYAPSYKPTANPDIDVDISKNMLAPDFSTKGGKYLYPQSALQNGQKNVVEITMTGDLLKDFKAANEASGFSSFGSKAPRLTQNGETIQYTWHHLDDYNPKTGKCTMQLVEQSAHTKVEGMGHSGGAAQYRVYNGNGYE